MKLTGKNIIGSSLSGRGNNRFTAINPETDQALETEFFEAEQEEIDVAIRQAADAFGPYKQKTGEEKSAFLIHIADEIMALGDALIRRCMQETGLPEGRLQGERQRTVNQLKLFAELVREGSWVEARIDTARPDRLPLPKPDVRSLYKPLGPVGIFGASNFPLAFSVAGGDTASALAAGCPVVVKAHYSHPGTCELVGHAIQRAVKKSSMPEGVFSLVHGKSNKVGIAIVNHPQIRAIGFTGSFGGGKALFDAAGKRMEPIPVYAEMGSTNPVFILPGALKQRGDEIALGLTNSVTLGTGQFCTNPGLVFLEQSEDEEKFKKKLSEALAEVQPGVMLNRGITEHYINGIRRLSGIDGVDILAGEQKSENGNLGTPCLLATTANRFFEHDELEEEVFGPSTLAVTASGKDELIVAASRLKGHLTATIHGTEQDLTDYADLVNILEQKAGRLLFNGYPTGVEVCHPMVHGGPYPATTDSKSTSVGTMAIYRFVRPVCYQNFPHTSLPDELKDENPLGIWRLVNGERTKQQVSV